jgi:hypothetical protein
MVVTLTGGAEAAAATPEALLAGPDAEPPAALAPAAAPAASGALLHAERASKTAKTGANGKAAWGNAKRAVMVGTGN